ncbi:uncharacterized protein LOC106135581 [Amyelois transitella]|uniref:uncharacterized protein LOC106135581 n=1 Tax=Amyelois transitella TaxID=680683 RepID=UPI00299068FE|nr:uncharacterized protein LOC106135581 [Amyelois transitella]
MFEGELDSLTPRQKELISEVLENRGLKVEKVRIETLGQAGDNYAANVKKIIVELRNGDTFKIVAKIAPTVELLRNTMGTVLLFGNECVMYNDILPKFVDIQRAAGLPNDEIFRYPECYETFLEPPNEIILLEDLRESGLKMLDRFTPLPNEHIKVILKNFANYHSLSFVLKKQDPKIFDSLIGKLGGNFYRFLGANPDFKYYFKNLENDTISVLDSDLDKEAVRGTVSKMFDHHEKVYEEELNSRFSVVVHGDAWTNNIMFQFEKNVPKEVVFIDYQMIKLGSPVNDLQYMIFNCTDYNTRHQHFHEWIDFYHSELEKCLQKFNLDVNEVYPRNQLDADLRKYSKLYLAVVIMSHSMLIRKSEDAAKLKDAMNTEISDPENFKKMTEDLSVTNLDTESVGLFKRKIVGLIQSYRDLGYLENMAEFKFEGEVEILTQKQKDLVTEVLQTRGLKATKVRIETLGQAGDNYIANVKKITAVLDNGKIFKMIAKVAPTNEILRATMNASVLFGNECIIYNEILPEFTALQKAAGLSHEECFRFAECYGTLMEPLSEILLLEDLKDSKFEMLDRFTPLTNESIRHILKNFAVLHSLSFALKKQDPDKFIAYSKQLQDFYSKLSGKQHFQAYLDNMEKGMISMLDSDFYKGAVRGTISKLAEHWQKISALEKDLRYSVVTHGDAWTNNILFRVEENVPVEAILIDYQMSKVGNPVNDLMYLLFSSTDHITRHEHFYEWLDYYHSEMDKSLNNFDLKASDVYPREQLDADLRRYSKVSFCTAIMVFNVLIRQSEDASKMKEAMSSNAELKELMETVQSANLNPEYVVLFKNKMENLIDSYNEFGYLD